MNCHAADNFIEQGMAVIFMSAALVCRLVCCRSEREYSFVLKVGSINSLFQIFDFRREDFVSE